MTVPGGRPLVLTRLHGAYRLMRRELTASLADRNCDQDAPWAWWRPGDDGEADDEWLQDIPAGLLLAQAAELAGLSAARALRGHLAILTRAYWPDIDEPADDPVEHPAIYPPARAALEAAAVASWALDPVLTLQVRARRGAELMLWSQAARRCPEAGWHDTATRAGLDVSSTKRKPDTYAVHTDGQRLELSMSRMVQGAFGAEGADLYSAWSGITHPDPLAHAPGVILVERLGGYGYSRDIREDEDVAVAANVAQVVGATIDKLARYWGRSTAPADAVWKVRDDLQEFLQEVSAAVAARSDPE